MENKINKNIFECAFESFELDDAFILDVDNDFPEHKIVTNDVVSEKKVNKSKLNHKEIKISHKNQQLEDVSFFLEDLNESDFFEHNSNKKHSSEVTNNKSNNEAKVESTSNNDNCCLSPILKLKAKNLTNTFSSTPLKPNNISDSEENFPKISKCASLEADLFDDWNAEMNSQKDSITLSQALKLIEEVELEKQSNEKENLDTSIDLLTGKPIGTDLENLFAESFNLPSSAAESNQKRDVLNNSFIMFEESNTGSKPLAVQKLNFETKSNQKQKSFEINFNSDDDFDFLTQELLKKSKLKSFNTDESNEIIKKRRKCCRIIESDSGEDSPARKSNKNQSKKKIEKKRNIQGYFARDFIELEAEVSNISEVSSEEAEEEGEYDSSFVDEELYLTQNCSANMTAKYLESVQSPNRPGRFKIPALKPYYPANVFSQSPDDNNTEYELDSFCVNETEDEIKTELSDLEIAENILEKNRKRKKRVPQGSVKIK